jgi:hypothetical protein
MYTHAWKTVLDDEKEELEHLIEEHEKELRKIHEHADHRTGLERRGGRERRRKQEAFEGEERRRPVGRRGKFDRRTGGKAFGYKDEPDDTNKK